MHDLRVRRDFQELATESKLFAILVTTPAPAILSADADIHFANRHRPTGRPEQPTAHQVRFGVRAPHETRWRSEATLDQDFSIGRRARLSRFHFLRSFFCVCFNSVSRAS